MCALPLDQHRGGVVPKVAGLVCEDNVHQPAHRLRGAGVARLPKAGAADTVESAPRHNRWVPQTHLVAGLRRTPPDGVSGRGLGHRHAGLSAGFAGTNGDPFATPEAA